MVDCGLWKGGSGNTFFNHYYTLMDTNDGTEKYLLTLI
jgi:hypothetical protein